MACDVVAPQHRNLGWVVAGGEVWSDDVVGICQIRWRKCGDCSPKAQCSLLLLEHSCNVVWHAVLHLVVMAVAGGAHQTADVGDGDRIAGKEHSGQPLLVWRGKAQAHFCGTTLGPATGDVVCHTESMAIIAQITELGFGFSNPRAGKGVDAALMSWSSAVAICGLAMGFITPRGGMTVVAVLPSNAR